MIFGHSMPWLLITLRGGSEHAFWSFYAMAFDHFGGWIGACFGGSGFDFWSFYAMGFDHFGGWIRACFWIILC